MKTSTQIQNRILNHASQIYHQHIRNFNSITTVAYKLPPLKNNQKPTTMAVSGQPPPFKGTTN
jgi:hypothetical protein